LSSIKRKQVSKKTSSPSHPNLPLTRHPDSAGWHFGLGRETFNNKNNTLCIRHQKKGYGKTAIIKIWLTFWSYLQSNMVVAVLVVVASSKPFLVVAYFHTNLVVANTKKKHLFQSFFALFPHTY